MKKVSINAIGKRGMVSTPNPVATKAALDILRKGGNSIDAAIAANMTLSVLLPDQCGLGGDLFALVYDPQTPLSPVVALNGSGYSSEKATISSIIEQGHQSMPQTGPLSITVPGTVQAWGKLSERWGKLAWEELFDTSIELAKNGFIVNKAFSQSIQSSISKLEMSEASRIYLPKGNPLRPGKMLKQQCLANTLEIIKEKNWSSFYIGDIGESIIKSIQKEGGVIGVNDLLEYSIEWDKPISTFYREYEVFTTPPNSRGMVLLALLDKLNKVNLSKYDHLSKESILLLVNLYREVIQDLDQKLGDPKFIDFDTFYTSGKNLIRNEDSKKINNVNLEGDTVSICVIDENGLGISLIQSVYHDFGSGIYVEPVGIFMQNRGASFCLNVDHPNCLAPRKRPLHTLLPTIVRKDGNLSMLLGSRGGAGQPQTLVQLLTAIIDYGFSIQEALELPRWVYGSTTSERYSDGLIMESMIPTDVFEGLKDKKYPVSQTKPYSVNWMGCAQIIMVDQEMRLFYGGADPRGGGLAKGC